MGTDGQTGRHDEADSRFSQFCEGACNPGPLPLFPLQIFHELQWDRTRAFAVTGWWLNTWAMARKWLNFVKITSKYRFPTSQKTQLLHYQDKTFKLCLGKQMAFIKKSNTENTHTHIYIYIYWNTWCCSWLEHCATRRRVAGSITYGITATFHCHNPAAHTKVLASNQLLTEFSARIISCG